MEQYSDMKFLTDSVWKWGVGIPILFAVITCALRWGQQWPKTVRGSNGADMVAYTIVSAVCCTYVGVAGCIAWFDMCHDCDLDDIKSDKIYGRSDFFEAHLSAPLLTYQFWNFVFCLGVTELRDAVTLIHHIASGLCALFSFHPFLQYYGLFFYGVPEVSSVPLGYVTLAKCFPFLKTDYPLIHSVSKWVFAVLFILIRLVLWTQVTFFYWVDTLKLIQGGDAHSMVIVVYFCVANVILTSMQYYWGYIIVRQMFSGSSESKKKDKKK